MKVKKQIRRRRARPPNRVQRSMHKAQNAEHATQGGSYVSSTRRGDFWKAHTVDYGSRAAPSLFAVHARWACDEEYLCSVASHKITFGVKSTALRKHTHKTNAPSAFSSQRLHLLFSAVRERLRISPFKLTKNIPNNRPPPQRSSVASAAPSLVYQATFRVWDSTARNFRRAQLDTVQAPSRRHLASQEVPST